MSDQAGSPPTSVARSIQPASVPRSNNLASEVASNLTASFPEPQNTATPSVSGQAQGSQGNGGPQNSAQVQPPGQLPVQSQDISIAVPNQAASAAASTLNPLASQTTRIIGTKNTSVQKATVNQVVGGKQQNSAQVQPTSSLPTASVPSQQVQESANSATPVQNPAVSKPGAVKVEIRSSSTIQEAPQQSGQASKPIQNIAQAVDQTTKPITQAPRLNLQSLDQLPSSDQPSDTDDFVIDDSFTDNIDTEFIPMPIPIPVYEPDQFDPNPPAYRPQYQPAPQESDDDVEQEEEEEITESFSASPFDEPVPDEYFQDLDAEEGPEGVVTDPDRKSPPIDDGDAEIVVEDEDTEGTWGEWEEIQVEQQEEVGSNDGEWQLVDGERKGKKDELERPGWMRIRVARRAVETQVPDPRWKGYEKKKGREVDGEKVDAVPRVMELRRRWWGL